MWDSQFLPPTADSEFVDPESVYVAITGCETPHTYFHFQKCT